MKLWVVLMGLCGMVSLAGAQTAPPAGGQSSAVASAAAIAKAKPRDISPTTRPVGPLPKPDPAIERALVISIDGLRPDVLLRADAPNIHKLYHSGAFSFWAYTTGFAITLPSHTSMLTGVTPTRHGIEWNRDLPLKTPIYPNVATLFQVAHRAGYTTAMAAGKSKFSTLNVPGSIDWVFIPSTTKTDDGDVARHAVAIIKAHKPQVMFIHFPQTDNAGHQYGWGTPEQLKAVAGADAALGQVLAALDDEGLRASTFILLSADHGGAGRGHGPEDPRSRHIPWIAVGPGIRKDFDLTRYPKLEIHTEDTFATVCWLMGIPVPTRDLDGKPIKQILMEDELMHVAP
ncbi:MAG TPA: alkaline phosphatase family protein [Tepidisphaeraceae bacterium]|nr:alkaline phosphatase family protein [Tepidisphaeraceae bacterium]